MTVVEVYRLIIVTRMDICCNNRYVNRIHESSFWRSGGLVSSGAPLQFILKGLSNMIQKSQEKIQETKTIFSQ